MMETLLLLAALSAPIDYWVSGRTDYDCCPDSDLTAHFRLDPDAPVLHSNNFGQLVYDSVFEFYRDGVLVEQNNRMGVQWTREATPDRDVYQVHPSQAAQRGYVWIYHDSKGTVPHDVLPDFSLPEWDLDRSRILMAPPISRLVDGLTLHIGPDPPIGDSNYNLQFEFDDILTVMAPGKYETGLAATWAEGDWNHDGRFDFSDILAALGTGSYESGFGSQQAAEPYLVVLLMPLVFLMGRMRPCRPKQRS